MRLNSRIFELEQRLRHSEGRYAELRGIYNKTVEELRNARDIVRQTEERLHQTEERLHQTEDKLDKERQESFQKWCEDHQSEAQIIQIHNIQVCFAAQQNESSHFFRPSVPSLAFFVHALPAVVNYMGMASVDVPPRLAGSLPTDVLGLPRAMITEQLVAQEFDRLLLDERSNPYILKTRTNFAMHRSIPRLDGNGRPIMDDGSQPSLTTPDYLQVVFFDQRPFNLSFDSSAFVECPPRNALRPTPRGLRISPTSPQLPDGRPGNSYIIGEITNSFWAVQLKVSELARSFFYLRHLKEQPIPHPSPSPSSPFSAGRSSPSSTSELSEFLAPPQVEFPVPPSVPLEDSFAFFFVAVSSNPPPCVVRAFADTVRYFGFGSALDAGRFKLLFLDLATQPDKPRLVDVTAACAPSSPFAVPN
ncbi:hypothetical protein PAPYR_5182 [Paratrimastix pyriformis]|uniref:Uncharacterized protein n=1 Tax=Paratrimastix pyriformis TaxID=342808 RepID=A0ABQ8UI48_9EUKA|nr:hypothetical protein PAPYR_5182 [Paratrimastix pyriformis]